jgi:hypothetical protein
VQYLKAQQAADLLGWPVERLVEDTKNGGIVVPFFRSGHIVRYSQAILERIKPIIERGEKPEYIAMAPEEARATWPKDWKARLVAVIHGEQVFIADQE